jgi:hypothetical protein
MTRPTPGRHRRATRPVRSATLAMATLALLASCTTATAGAPESGPAYPLHTDIVATTFWVGEIFDPNTSDGSQVISTYDSQWAQHYGGCDGVIVNGDCATEPRSAGNRYFPTQMTPTENPFYLDLPFDDLNDPVAFADRGSVIPWAQHPGYTGHQTDPAFSYMKNRWVAITNGGRTCYGQIQDAGPGAYHDTTYVFGADNQRPLNTRYHSAGMDVSPALNGCLGFADLNGENDHVDWRFVELRDVPDGPWRTVITTSHITP